jgi:Fe-S oxidoreductase
MSEIAFESALSQRVEEMLDACVKCGRCFEACPIKEPAGLTEAEPVAAISGIIDIIRTGRGSEAARTWANSCLLSGECIKACDYGVNPRFLLGMARVRMAQEAADKRDQRRAGVHNFRTMAEGVNVLSRMQLTEEQLARLGQQVRNRLDAAARTAPKERPDFVFYTGCNVLRTPHIALLALDIMDRLGISYRVMGGPDHCCGVIQMRTGDTETAGRFSTRTMEKLADAKTGEVLSWCPSCHV